jgi:dTDP-4-amino-4,6-dideoxygalactose transaminase
LSVPFLDLRAMTDEVRPAVVRAWSVLLQGDQFVGGASVERFESAWADYCGTADAVGVANGADAVHLTLRALDIGAGDEVIVPANAFVGLAEAVTLAGATPRFADVEAETLLIGPASFEEAVNERTAAVIVVHLYGQMADMDAINEVALRAGVVVIEDASEAHGASWRGHRAGSFSRAGCFSFDPKANLGAFGDAGAVTTSDLALASRLRALRSYGRLDSRDMDGPLLGVCSRMDSVQADVLNAKLPWLETWTQARRELAARYRQVAQDVGIEVVAEAEGSLGVYHRAVVRPPLRERVRMVMDSLGVETRVHYRTPLHLLSVFESFWTAPLPVVEQAAHEVLSLPMSPHLDEDQVARVCHALEVVATTLRDERPGAL